MGCSQSTPAGDSVCFHRSEIGHEYNSFTEAVSHPPVRSKDEGNPLSVSHRSMTSNSGGNPVLPVRSVEVPTSLTTGSSPPDISLSHDRLLADKKDENQHDACLDKPNEQPDAQETNRLPSAPIVGQQISAGAQTGVEAPRVRSKKQQPPRSIKANCRKSGNGGALRPTKPVLTPDADGFSAIGSLLIIDAPLSPRRSVALAAVAAACRAKDFTKARLTKATERTLATDKVCSASKQGKDTQDKGFQRDAFGDGGQTLPQQEDPGFNKTPKLKKTDCNSELKTSLPPASLETTVRVDAAKGENRSGESAPTEKRYSSTLQRLKDIKPKLAHQLYVCNRFHQLRHLKSKASYDQHDLVDGKRTATTAVAPEVRENGAKLNSEPQDETKGRKLKHFTGVLSRAALRSAEKKKSASKSKLLRDQRNDARRTTCYASMENTKVALTRRAKALRCSMMLIIASVKCAFWSLFTSLDRSHESKANRLPQSQCASVDPHQTDRSLELEGRSGRKGDINAVQESAESQECASEHVKVKISETASVRVAGTEVASDQATTLASGEINTTASMVGPFGGESNETGTKLSFGGSRGFNKEMKMYGFEEQKLFPPSQEELRSVWCVMKIGAAQTIQQKAEWLHRLELLIVNLDPTDTREPTRNALLEARLLDRCVDFLRDSPDSVELCASSLAIMVCMSLNEETSKQLTTNHGYEVVTDVLKKYYTRCVGMATEHAKTHISDTDLEPPRGKKHEADVSAANESGIKTTAESSTERTETSLHPEDPGRIGVEVASKPHREAADSNTTPDKLTNNREGLSVQGAERTLQADNGTPSDVCHCHAKTTTRGQPGAAEKPQLRMQTGVEAYDPDHGVEAPAVGMSPEAQLAEVLTLIWRIMFASSLDGDKYAQAPNFDRFLEEMQRRILNIAYSTERALLDAQTWVAAGAAEPAVESLASDLPVFSSARYICWVFGALRFLPITNAALCIDLVQHRQLFKSVVQKMEMHSKDPMLMENGFAVLANYQRNHPAHTAILCNIPEVWRKCVDWLRSPEIFYAPDTVYQGLYAVGLACSYSLDACLALRQAGGMDVATRLAEAYEVFPQPEFRLNSNVSTSNSSESSSEQYSADNDNIEEGCGDDSAETAAGYTGASDDSADTVATESSVRVQRAPWADMHLRNTPVPAVSDSDTAAPESSMPLQRSPPVEINSHNPPVAAVSDCIERSTTEKMKVVFQFAEGLTRLLDSCVVTGELAPHSLREEAITEEDEEESDEEGDDDVHGFVQHQGETCEKTEGLPGASQSTEIGKESLMQKDGLFNVSNTVEGNGIEATMNDAPYFGGPTEPASDRMQRKELDTPFSQKQQPAASCGRSNGCESQWPCAEARSPEKTELKVGAGREESEDGQGRRKGKNVDVNTAKEASMADILEPRDCSGHAENKEDSGEKIIDDFCGRSAATARRVPEILDGHEYPKAKPSRHAQDAQEAGQKVKYPSLVSYGEAPPLQEQQRNTEVVEEEHSSGAQMQNGKNTFRATSSGLVQLNGRSENQTKDENASIESGGSLIIPLELSISSLQIEEEEEITKLVGSPEEQEAVGSPEEQEAVAKRPESDRGLEQDEAPTTALPVTKEGEAGFESEAVHSRKDAEEDGGKTGDNLGEVEMESENDFHSHLHETLLLLPSYVRGQYSKCPTCEVDEEDQEEESDNDREGERQLDTVKHEQQDSHVESAGVLHQSECSRRTRNSPTTRKSKKQFRCSSSHFSQSPSVCSCSLADGSAASIHHVYNVAEEDKAPSTTNSPPDRHPENGNNVTEPSP